jgi:hypothetical protein
MLLFTDLHYRSCAISTGHPAWPGPSGRLQVVAEARPSLASSRWANRILKRVEHNFAAAADRLTENRSEGVTTRLLVAE